MTEVRSERRFLPLIFAIKCFKKKPCFFFCLVFCFLFLFLFFSKKKNWIIHITNQFSIDELEGNAWPALTVTSFTFSQLSCVKQNLINL